MINSRKGNKKVVVISERAQQRKRISFWDYARKKEYIELIVEWIFLPVRFSSYGLLLSDGSSEYRISYAIKPSVMDKIFEVFGIKAGRDYTGKVLLVKKKNGQITIEEGAENAIYLWISGKGWKLKIEKDDIPF